MNTLIEEHKVVSEQGDKKETASSASSSECASLSMVQNAEPPLPKVSDLSIFPKSKESTDTQESSINLFPPCG